jgi:hypothetical protein
MSGVIAALQLAGFGWSLFGSALQLAGFVSAGPRPVGQRFESALRPQMPW